MVTTTANRERGRPLNQCHIAIEGAIGVGKTTLTTKLAEKLGSEAIFEEVKENPFLALFYQDPTRHALAVQLSFLFSRLKQWQTLQQQNLFTQGVVSDYIFAKDHIFANVTLSNEELILYQQVCRLLEADVHRPDLVIYLQSTPEVIMERIRRRNRSMEHGLTMEYLKKVMGAYDQFFFHYQEAPLLIVQTDRMNFADHDDAIDALIERIGNMTSQAEFWSDFSTGR